MVTVFALAAALLYGSADFLGGAATRRAHVLSVLLLSGTAGFAVVAVAALLAGGPPRAAGVIWGACYLLWMYQRVFYGKVTHPINNSMGDLIGAEKAAIWPCAVAALVMGVAPILWLGSIDPAVHAALNPVSQAVSKLVGQ